ncbi:MAG TPA: pseudouridine synthase [Anaerolineales bacterium]|nr:pseudouridine synthase [Anaerolineales bacterium]
MPSERLQKILARAGLGSRRACEEIITAGRVTVNNQIAILGQKADPVSDSIKVDGQPIEAPQALTYIALYKPRGVVSSVKQEGSLRTINNLIDLPIRLYPVGRLDVDSEGLILLTNDGELANQLTHPRYGHEKEYRVLVARQPDENQVTTWKRGVVLSDGYRTQPVKLEVDEYFGKGAWLRIIMREGRKRQIRETGALLGLPVVRILRVRIGSLKLGVLKPGQWRNLTSSEIKDLKSGRSKPSKFGENYLHRMEQIEPGKGRRRSTWYKKSQRRLK